MISKRLFTGLIAATLLCGVAVSAQPQRPAAPAQPAKPPPVVTGAYWHHVQMNVADPVASQAFYTRHFKAEAATYDGAPAVWSQKSWLLFNKATAPVDKRRNSAIWHVGWGAPNPQLEYARQQGLGATFYQPLTDLAVNNGGTLGRFFYMYVQDPDGGLIELNTAGNDDFGHVHLFSEDPIVTGDWYMRVLGFTGRALATQTTPSRAARFGVNGRQLAPSSSLRMDNVNLIVYPVGNGRVAHPEHWAGVDGIQPTRGRLHDHLGIGVPNLNRALAELARVGVRPTGPIETKAGGRIRQVFIEGPDRIAIQLVEDNTPRPVG